MSHTAEEDADDSTGAVINLLGQWGVSEETQLVFRTQGIDYNCLDHMSEEDINILIPVDRIRDRIKFRAGLKKRRHEIDVISANTSSADTLSLDSDISSKIFDEFYDSPRRQPKLEDILKENNNGKQALIALKRNQLDQKSRSNLVKGVVEYYLKEFNNMNKNDFEHIAGQIKELCPREAKETYYIPSSHYGGKGHTIPARGKLVDRYYNQSRILRQAGVLPQKRKRKLIETLLEQNLDAVPNEEEEELKIWLRFNREPWPTVVDKWKLCHGLRKKTYDSKTATKLIDILNEWPCLKHSMGYTLIEIDFDKLYPDKSNSLLAKWEEFSKKAVAILKKDLEATKHDLLGLLENDDLNEDTRDLVILSLLPAKIRPTSKLQDPENKKKFYKTTIPESRESFIINVQNYAELETKLKTRRDSYSKKGLTCQPLLAAIGAADSLSDFIVVCDDVKYKFFSLPKALDICFKIYTVLNACYPLECEQVWAFVQKYFYDITYKTDKKLSLVSAFITDLGS